jgi:hypothetical protein
MGSLAQGRLGLEAGLRYTYTVVDVDGDRVVIIEGSHPDATPANIEQAAQVVESITFKR